MTVSAGTRLGPYEILSPLGAGGMGEVYRARDPRLGRDVAVKVLSEEFFESEERRQRFEREARLLATLNHPGIASIYSFEEVPSSSSSSSRHLLVMELVEGEGLDRRIAAGPLPLEEILSFSRQIAEALSAAHEKGIVHRDLKPANVRVTSGGRVKLLDFGLARALDAEGGAPETGETLAKLTQAGTIVGTVPYMSPEQVEARPLDHRSDLFSLGVLAELKTLRRAHESGASASVSKAAADSGAARAEEGFWVAVLPFKYSGANADLTAWPRRCPKKSSRACRASRTFASSRAAPRRGTPVQLSTCGRSGGNWARAM
jgi:serine/threonine protein kinase